MTASNFLKAGFETGVFDCTPSELTLPACKWAKLSPDSGVCAAARSAATLRNLSIAARMACGSAAFVASNTKSEGELIDIKDRPKLFHVCDTSCSNLTEA